MTPEQGRVTAPSQHTSPERRLVWVDLAWLIGGCSGEGLGEGVGGVLWDGGRPRAKCSGGLGRGGAEPLQVGLWVGGCISPAAGGGRWQHRVDESLGII